MHLEERGEEMKTKRQPKIKFLSALLALAILATHWATITYAYPTSGNLVVEAGYSPTLAYVTNMGEVSYWCYDQLFLNTSQGLPAYCTQAAKPFSAGDFYKSKDNVNEDELLALQYILSADTGYDEVTDRAIKQMAVWFYYQQIGAPSSESQLVQDIHNTFKSQTYIDRLGSNKNKYLQLYNTMEQLATTAAMGVQFPSQSGIYMTVDPPQNSELTLNAEQTYYESGVFTVNIPGTLRGSIKIETGHDDVEVETITDTTFKIKIAADKYSKALNLNMYIEAPCIAKKVSKLSTENGSHEIAVFDIQDQTVMTNLDFNIAKKANPPEEKPVTPVTPETKPEVTQEEKPSETPQTGDFNPSFVFILLGGISFTFIVKKAKKQFIKN